MIEATIVGLTFTDGLRYPLRLELDRGRFPWERRLVLLGYPHPDGYEVPLMDEEPVICHYYEQAGSVYVGNKRVMVVKQTL